MNIQVNQNSEIQDLQKNVSKIYFFSFFWMFLILIPIIVPYMESYGLSMHDIFLLQSLFGATIAILEVPSGYMGDLWGRKKTIVVGSFMLGVSFTVLIFAEDFWGFLLFEFFCGVALSLASGADFAILYDSIDLTDKSRGAKTNAVTNIYFARVSAESIASVIGGLLALWSFRHAIWAQMVTAWIPFLIALSLKEPPIDRMSQTKHWDNIKEVFTHLFAKKRILTYSFANWVVWGLATYTAVWTFQKYWQTEGISIGIFGFLWASYNLTVAIVTKYASRIELRFGIRAIIIMVSTLPICGFLGMAYLSGWLGVAAGFAFQVSRGINQVILKDAINARTPNHFRATLNSVMSLVFRAAFFFIGPAVGFGIDHLGLRPTFQILALAFLVCALLLAWPLIKAIEQEQSEAT